MYLFTLFQEPPEYYKLYPNLLRENPSNENAQECNVMTSQTNEAFENDDVTIRVETSITSQSDNHATTSPGDNQTTMMSQPSPPGSVTATNSNLAVTPNT